MRGGMRLNAGRPAYKRKTTACQRLDVRDLARAGALQPGRLCTWAWYQEGRVVASIRVEAVSEFEMRLRYSHNGTPAVSPIQLEQTGCNYGGSRTWCRCRRCDGRVAVLYFSGGGWACRKCARLSYPSQSDDMSGRSWRAQHKIETRLAGGKGEWNGWQKPKGMHQTTFDRLRNRVNQLEAIRDGLLADLASRYFNFVRCRA